MCDRPTDVDSIYKKVLSSNIYLHVKSIQWYIFS